VSSLSLSSLDFFFFAFKFQTSDVIDDYADDPATGYSPVSTAASSASFAHFYFGDPEESED
jgi:hypothetical protein